MTAAVEDRGIIVAQGIQKLMATRHPEVLMEGPAGTGKTFGLCLYAYLMCVAYPGARILFVRATRASMNESLLQLWEEEILGLEHPAVMNGAEREHRKRYVFPEATMTWSGKTYKGRSRVGLAGMDMPTRVMSTQWDVILYVEATEGTLHQWDYLSSRNRSQQRHNCPRIPARGCELRATSHVRSTTISRSQPLISTQRPGAGLPELQHRTHGRPHLGSLRRLPPRLFCSGSPGRLDGQSKK